MKTSLQEILGRADPPATEAQATRWIEGVAKYCQLFNLDIQVAEGLVNFTQANRRRPGFMLIHTNFTWQQYLRKLLDGDDMITVWAAHAFSSGNQPAEDFGLGQLPATLPDGFVINEHRQFPPGEDPSPANYLDKAIAWGHVTDAELRRRGGGG
ncbi:hypothetical protein SAMN05216359_101280 [Roseateles sp. YR242]|uniref:hypothetical protein n=1 Tax=Roseateles sp. YR242 TaxID=1855305 RepID=UPI0008D5A2B6|nr:hypothetical protein [Roseateles sp. YR242]SEK28095.1 hypothetical protein SAMN05216359_101280 [Roseateles sp. YR242]